MTYTAAVCAYILCMYTYACLPRVHDIQGVHVEEGFFYIMLSRVR